MQKMVLAAVAAVLLSCGAYGQEATSGMHSCEDLAQLELPGAKILSVQTVAAGAFAPPSNITPRLVRDPPFYKKHAAVCCPVGETPPDARSSLYIETVED